MDLSKKRIILSKTNRIGDVVISLPVASLLKQAAPDCHITMLTTKYTQLLPAYFDAIDEVICWDEETIQSNPVAALRAQQADIIIHLRAKKDIVKAAKMAKIPLRIGSTNRLYNWFYCNKLVKVNRKRHVPWHDAQLDIQTILPLTQQEMPSKEKIASLMQFKSIPTSEKVLSLLSPNKFNLILHPKSVTDAGKREWPLEYFAKVITTLNPEQYNIFISGTEKDGEAVRKLLCEPYPFVHDLTGKLTLEEFIQLIQKADGLVAGSTGPLHIAASLGIHTLGLYTPTPGHDPTRWGPLGKQANYLITDKIDCRACNPKSICPCIRDITPEKVIQHILKWRV